jgi:hypothetical protein
MGSSAAQRRRPVAVATKARRRDGEADEVLPGRVEELLARRLSLPLGSHHVPSQSPVASAVRQHVAEKALFSHLARGAH